MPGRHHLQSGDYAVSHAGRSSFARAERLHRSRNPEVAHQNQRLPQFLRASSHCRYRFLWERQEGWRTAGSLLSALARRQSECRWRAIWAPDHVCACAAHSRDYSRAPGFLPAGPSGSRNIFRLGDAHARQNHQRPAAPLGRGDSHFRGYLRGLGRHRDLFPEAGPRRVRGMMGTVYLIGAGPGDPALLTLKAARLLASANVVLHDALVSDAVLALISPAAEIINVGKRAGHKLLTQDEINAFLVSYGRTRIAVVRLKGGDPGIFGRAGEEIEALRKAGIEYEIVPGISAALGAAAAAGISLTDRRVASQILLTTFSRGIEGSAMDWGCVTSTTTLVLYMPGADYAEVSERLLAGGLPADLPCVIVSNAASSQQQLRWSSVGRLAGEEKLPAPALLIVGRVASREIEELRSAFWDGEGKTLPPQHLSVS